MLNNITIQGRLTKEPEMKQIPSGTHLVALTIACERPKKKDAEAVTDFLPAIAWAKTADFIQKYFHKGDQIIIMGRLQSRNYEGQDGKNHMAYEISISEASFAGSRNANHCPAPVKAEEEEINWDEIPDLPDSFD